MDDREFDQFLKSRYVPDAPSNLAARIVEASKTQVRPEPWFVKALGPLKTVGRLFAIPQPAMVLAAVVVLSIGGLGVYNTDLLTVEPTSEYYSEAEEVELAFYLDDIFETAY